MKEVAKIHFGNNDHMSVYGGVVLITGRNSKLDTVDNIRESPHLIVFSKSHLQTYLDVSGIDGHLLISFDKDKQFTGATSCNSTHNSNFALLTQAKYAVFIEQRLVNFNVVGISRIETDYYIK